MKLIYLSCAWVAGIFLGSKYDLPLALMLSSLAPLLFLIPFRRQWKAVLLAGVCLAIFAGGAFYCQTGRSTDSLYLYRNQIVELRGKVAAEPEISDRTTHLRLAVSEMKVDGSWQKTEGLVLLFVPRYPEYRYQDDLLVRGQLEAPPQFDSFDYQAYLAHEGIHSTMFYPGVQFLGSNKDFSLLRWVYQVRSRLSEVLGTVLPEPQAALARGIVLGIRSNIPESLKDDLSRTGTSHLLAISGLNLSIIAGVMVVLGLWLFGRRHYLYIWLALGLIWGYSLLTGLQAPVIRSAIMASLFLLAEVLGRQRSAITALTFSAAVMVGITPQVLWDASFQLSFLAMAGLIFISPLLRRLGRRAVAVRIGEEGFLAYSVGFAVDSFSVTLGAIIAVAPVIAYYFGIVSFIGPVSTLFIAPAFPFIMLSGALSAFLGLLFLPVGQFIAWFAWIFLTYMLVLVRAFSTLPFSFLGLADFDVGYVWAYYLLLAIISLVVANRRRIVGQIPAVLSAFKRSAGYVSGLAAGLPVRWAIIPLVLLAVFSSFTAMTMPDNNLHLSFLDVGEGDATLVQTGHQDILIDGGPSPQLVCLGVSERMPFWDRTIEMVILTHPHSDHLAGLVEVLKRYRVEQVLSSGAAVDSPLYREWLGLIRLKNINHIIVSSGYQVNLNDGTVIEVISPRSPPRNESEIDDKGLVLRVHRGGISFLLAADVGMDTELELIGRRANLDSDVLKIGHHGSNNSTTAEFLSAVSPHLAVISVGADNTLHLPGEQTMKLLEQRMGPGNIYRTDKRGAIEFITDGNELRMRTAGKTVHSY